MARAACALSERSGVNVVIFTRPHVVDAIKRALLDEVPAARVSVVGVSIPMWLVAMTRRRHVRIAYVVWQARAVSLARRMFVDEDDVVAHHVTFATEALPTFEWRLPEKWRLVFGPTGSSQMLNRQARIGGLVGVLRGAIRRWFGRLNLAKADLVICQNSWVADEVSSFTNAEVLVEPNIGVDLGAGQISDVRAGDFSCKFALVGGLNARKQPELAVMALSLLPQKYELCVVGSGVLEDKLRALADHLDVTDRLQFLGPLSHAEVMQILAVSGVLIHPSRQEGAPWVVGEAQSVGAVPVAFRGSGADTIIDLGASGVVVECVRDNPWQNASNLAAAIVDASGQTRTTTQRWNTQRFVGLMEHWYRLVPDDGELD